MSKWKAAIVAVVLSLLPAVALAHGLTGSGGWVDELVCLVPAAIMVVLVFVLGKNPKPPSTKKDKP